MIKFNFLKRLLSLFIFGLSFIGFSFGNWSINNIDTTFYPNGQSNYSLSVNSRGNGFLNGLGLYDKNIFYVPWGFYSNSNGYGIFYFDKNHDLNLISKILDGSANYGHYYFTSALSVPYSSFINSVAEDLSDLDDVSIVSYDSIKNIGSSVTKFAYAYKTISYYSLFPAICFIFDDSQVYCFVTTSYYSGTLYNVSQSVSLTTDPLEFDYSVVGSSPRGRKGNSFISSRDSKLSGVLVVNSGYSNSDMVDGYECLGLQPALCYGGFPINNIFQPDEQFDNFTGYVAGQGATIFEIYNLYSGSFSTINQFLDTVVTRYRNGQINSFKTEPKALLMLGAQMNTAGLKTSSISTYCDLLLNRDNSSIYTGDSADDLMAQSCFKSQKIKQSLRNSLSGDDVGFQTTHDGIFSGDDLDFDPDTFFSNIMNEITTKLDSNSLYGGNIGIIPGYIIAFTIALIFIRIISH